PTPAPQTPSTEPSDSAQVPPAAPQADPAAARAKLSQLGLAGSTLRQITDSAALRLVKMDAGLITELGAGGADKERAFARKIDSLPQTSFDKLTTLSGSEQKRISKLTSQQMVDELNKIKPAPTP